MIQRPLPPGVTLAQCAVFSGTDKGASWGPGMALAWKNKTLRINLRGEGRCGVDDGAGQWFGSFVAPNYWHYLRIRVEKNDVLAEASPDNRLWETIHALPRSQFQGDPVAVCIGKMSPGGKGEDFAEAGDARRLLPHQGPAHVRRQAATLTMPLDGGWEEMDQSLRAAVN